MMVARNTIYIQLYMGFFFFNFIFRLQGKWNNLPEQGEGLQSKPVNGISPPQI